MPANGPSQAERGYVIQQEVHGAVLTYDRAGHIIDKPASTTQDAGPFSHLEIRLNRASETWRQVETAHTPGDKVHIKVAGAEGGFTYKIKRDLTFDRTRPPVSGQVSELRVRVNSGNEESVIDIFQGCGPDDDVVFIVTQSSPTCRYRLNQATGQWERVCG